MRGPSEERGDSHNVKKNFFSMYGRKGQQFQGLYHSNLTPSSSATIIRVRKKCKSSAASAQREQGARTGARARRAKVGGWSVVGAQNGTTLSALPKHQRQPKNTAADL